VQLLVRLVFSIKGFLGKSLCTICVHHCYSYVLDSNSIFFLHRFIKLFIKILLEVQKETKDFKRPPPNFYNDDLKGKDVINSLITCLEAC
jgi:hypothetical protein